MIAPAALEAIKAALGPDGYTTDPAVIALHLVEWRKRWTGATPLLALPRDAAQVAALVRACAATGTPLVPQGGNTGLVGGQIPSPDGSQILLSLKRMTRIRSVDAANDSLIAEAGVVLADVQTAATGADRLFPLSLASEGSATIGGCLSTNAGGVHVLAYGMARDLCLGLEAVLPDGAVWNGLRTLRKDNTGYDLKNLLIGAEGTLGVITAAALKLFPKPRVRTTAYVALPDVAASIALLERLKAAGPLVAFEFMARIGLEFVTRHVAGCRDPFAAPHPWVALAEFASADPAAPLGLAMERALAQAAADGLVRDAVVAQSDAQAAAFWRLRESLSEAQGHEGGSIKHDVSVSVSALPAFIAEASAAALRVVPGCRPCPFGHAGDGNVHFNVSQPEGADAAAFLARREAMTAAVHAVVARFGGSISAEHGVGQAKRAELAAVKDPAELALMRTIKRALDPRGIMNPGKVV